MKLVWEIFVLMFLSLAGMALPYGCWLFGGWWGVLAWAILESAVVGLFFLFYRSIGGGER